MFTNREEAGKILAKRFLEEVVDFDKDKIIVFGIPRGGIVVAKSFASELSIKKIYPIFVRKIRHPLYPEVALGAICENKIIWNEFARDLKENEVVKDEIEYQKKFIEERKRKYSVDFPRIEGKDVIIIDDGLATGATMLAAIKCIKNKAKRVFALAPVASLEAYNKIMREAIPIVVEVHHDFYAVGQYYLDFREVSDDEVLKLVKNED